MTSNTAKVNTPNQWKIVSSKFVTIWFAVSRKFDDLGVTIWILNNLSGHFSRCYDFLCQLLRTCFWAYAQLSQQIPKTKIQCYIVWIIIVTSHQPSHLIFFRCIFCLSRKIYLFKHQDVLYFFECFTHGYSKYFHSLITRSCKCIFYMYF